MFAFAARPIPRLSSDVTESPVLLLRKTITSVTQFELVNLQATETPESRLGIEVAAAWFTSDRAEEKSELFTPAPAARQGQAIASENSWRRNRPADRHCR